MCISVRGRERRRCTHLKWWFERSAAAVHCSHTSFEKGIKFFKICLDLSGRGCMFAMRNQKNIITMYSIIPKDGILPTIMGGEWFRPTSSFLDACIVVLVSQHRPVFLNHSYSLQKNAKPSKRGKEFARQMLSAPEWMLPEWSLPFTRAVESDRAIQTILWFQYCRKPSLWFANRLLWFCCFRCAWAAWQRKHGILLGFLASSTYGDVSKVKVSHLFLV